MFLREEREASKIGRHIRSLLKGPGWKALKDDLSDDEIYDWYDENRRREVHENPFVGFKVEHEARLYMLLLLQKYVDASAYGLVFERAMHASAANELAKLLHVPLPAPTPRPTRPPEGLVNPAAFGFKVEPSPWNPPQRAKTALELQAEWLAAGNTGLYPLPPPRTTEQILKDLGYSFKDPETAPPPPPPPRSENRAAKLAKLLALISHPNTGEAERVAAMAAYQRVMGEAVG